MTKPGIFFWGLVLIMTSYHAHALIEVYDRYGRQIDRFADREAAFDDDFVEMEGFLEAANPPDACEQISPPSFLTNFTLSRFVLINATESCGFVTKVRNAQNAGFDLAVLFDPTPSFFHHFHLISFPKFDIDIQVVFVGFSEGLKLRDFYLYNRSYEFNYRIKIKPDSPDITYYMYLFGGVIAVCFFVMLIFLICLLVKCVQERRKSRRNRLSSRQIKQIPTAKFVKGDPYVVCAICLEDYNEGEKLRILPCSHAYHSNCIDPWLRNNRRNCPLCKRKITFGDSEDESGSEDSELTSPAENTPLLLPGPFRQRGWGTFFSNDHHNDGSGPSSSGRQNYGIDASDSTNQIEPVPTGGSINLSESSELESRPTDIMVSVAVNYNNDGENTQTQFLHYSL